MKISHLTLYILFLLGTESIAQANIDSVLSLFKIALEKSDTAYVDTLRAYEAQYSELIADCSHRMAFYKSYSNFRYDKYSDAEVVIIQKDSILPLQKKCLSDADPEIITTYLNIGRSYGYMEDHEQAEKYFIIVNDLQSKSPIIGPRFSKRYSEIGDFYSRVKAYKKSSMFYERSAYAFLGEKNSEQYVNILKGNAISLMDQGDYEKAHKILQQATNIATELLEYPKDNLSLLYDRLAVCYRKLNNFKKAEKSISEARRLMKASGSEGLKDARVYASRHGAILKSWGKYDEALEVYDEVLEIHKQIGAKLTLGKVSGVNEDIADVYFEKGDYFKSLEYYQKGIEYLIDFHSMDLKKNPVINTRKIVDRGYLHRQLGLKAKALHAQAIKSNDLDYYISTIDAVLKYDTLGQLLLQKNWEEATHQNLITKSNDYYKMGVRAALKMHKATGEKKYIAQAQNISSRYKAQLLSRGISIKNKKKRILNDSLIQLEKSLLKSVNHMESQYLAALVAGREEEKRIAFGELMGQKAKVDKFNLDNRISEQLETDQIRAVPTLIELQAYLKNDEALVEYCFIGDSAYSFLITPSSISYDRIDLENSEIDQFLSWLHGNDADYNSNELSQKLLKTLLRSDTANIAKLILIPDQKLLQLPFEALRMVDSKYLIERFDVSYCYATSFLESRTKSASEDHFLGFACDYNTVSDSIERIVGITLSPLPYAVEEVAASNDLLDGKIFINQSATKENFTDFCEDANIIHLALHSALNHSYPDQSSLIFESDSSDLFLTASEIYNLDLNSELTVLSACNTAVGKLNLGDGVRSLTRSFIHAGSASVLTTLWEAPDISTSKIIHKFYQGLKSEKEKDVALREAKLAYLQNIQPAYRHPKYWAHLILVGNTRSVQLTKAFPGTNKIILISVTLVALILMFFFRRTKKGI